MHDERLSSTQRLVLFVFRTFCDARGAAYPSYVGIAEACALARRTVIRAIKDVEDAGWLRRVKTPGRGNLCWVATYPEGFNLHTREALLPEQPTSDTGSPGVTHDHLSVTESPYGDRVSPRTEQPTSDTGSPGVTHDHRSVIVATMFSDTGSPEQNKNRSTTTTEEEAREAALATSAPTVDEVIAADQITDPAAWVETLARTLGIDVRVGGGAGIFADAFRQLGNDADLARDYIRWKLNDLAGAEKKYSPRSVARILQADVPDWLQMRRETTVGRHTTPAPTNAPAAHQRAPEPDPLPTPDPVSASTAERSAAGRAWAAVQRAISDTGMSAASDTARRLTAHKLSAGVLTVGGADPFDTYLFRDKYADLIPLDELRALHGVERIEWHLPEDLL